MSITRRAATARSDMRTSIRGEVRDPATDRSGATRAAASLRWSNTEVDAAFNLALEELGREIGFQNPGMRVVPVEMTYPGSSSDEALPAGITSADAIYKVEDVRDSSRALPIEYVSPAEIERFAVSTNTRVVPWTAFRYTLVGGTTETRIAVRPKPSSGLTLRISAIVPPTITGADADAHPFTSQWCEFLVLLAASKLLRPDNEFSIQQMTDLERLRRQMLSASTRQGNQRIRSRRRFR